MRGLFCPAAAKKYVMISVPQPFRDSEVLYRFWWEFLKIAQLRKRSLENVRKQKGRSTLAGSALILSDSKGFDDVDTPGIHFSGRAGICALCVAVSRADLHDNFAIP
ncbi:hypothetical protein GGI59_004908 [Rhizobium lentis]|uniref:Uncharacterized protein n=1 Tax=Rhizobium lentis TaxID=1138194 RepID=A0A7W8XI23_9HYPH|nr:hypothetical protein [Rhizobium lentis]MBB5552676.1 hypothetical protein [Rhizobium lentis]MBB5563216.1 hypothetical protein [Rhizobium lentis]MBB5569493.1 hypothetical protein [Rhizobium lentis]